MPKTHKTVVLGIDAAWTRTQPSGVALVVGSGTKWSCLAATPSYAAFEQQSHGDATDWGVRPSDGSPDCAKLIAAVKRLAGRPPDVIAIDMPLSHKPITARRAADTEVSRRFGARKCSTHSPSATRPGALADELRAELEQCGLPLATQKCLRPAVIEVYPHLALLQLCAADERLKYKVANTRKYWRDTSVEKRIALLLAEWRRIVAALERWCGPLGFTLPREDEVTSLAGLKRYEDALDALVCAYVGTCFAAGSAEPFGNADAAIWAPRMD